MERIVLYELKSLYRDSMKVYGYRFGTGKKTVCIVGAMRGNEVQQMFLCAQLVNRLQRLEKLGKLRQGKSILVIPSLNTYSLNIGKRFWPTDNTDINRMFPGYDLGETTQRVAAGVFEQIKDYEYGIQFASFYIPGLFLPHVKIMRTDYMDLESAKKFGLPYVVLREPRPYDTTTLNYNWQIWNTKAFSLYASSTEQVDERNAAVMVKSVLTFLGSIGVLSYISNLTRNSEVVCDSDFVSVNAKHAGILLHKARINAAIEQGEEIAWIIDAFTGALLERVLSPVRGKLYYTYQRSLIDEGTILCQIIPESAHRAQDGE